MFIGDVSLLNLGAPFIPSVVASRALVVTFWDNGSEKVT